MITENVDDPVITDDSCAIDMIIVGSSIGRLSNSDCLFVRNTSFEDETFREKKHYELEVSYVPLRPTQEMNAHPSPVTSIRQVSKQNDFPCDRSLLSQHRIA